MKESGLKAMRLSSITKYSRTTESERKGTGLTLGIEVGALISEMPQHHQIIEYGTFECHRHGVQTLPLPIPLVFPCNAMFYFILCSLWSFGEEGVAGAGSLLPGSTEGLSWDRNHFPALVWGWRSHAHTPSLPALPASDLQEEK